MVSMAELRVMVRREWPMAPPREGRRLAFLGRYAGMRGKYRDIDATFLMEGEGGVPRRLPDAHDHEQTG